MLKKKNIAWILVALLTLLWPMVFDNPFLTHIGVLIFMFMLLGFSMNLMLRIGQLSFAHGSLMGLGAYGSTLLMMRLDFPFALAFLCSGLISALFALITGPIMLRIKGVYFVLLTFSVGEVIHLMFIEWVSLFGGNNGIFGVPKASLFGYVLTSRYQYYLFAVILAFLTYRLVKFLYESEIGSVIDGLNKNEELARSLGINAMRYRLVVFTISSFIAGICGGFFASYYSFVTPESFSFWTAVDSIVMNVLGGIASPIGPVIGAIILVPLPEILRDTKEYQILLYGALLIVFLMFLPHGVTGYFKSWCARRRSK